MSQTKTQLVEGLSINTSAPADALAIGDNGEFGIAGNNYGTSGQVLTSQGSGSAPQWSTIASDKIEESNTSAEVVDTGSDGHFKVITDGTEALRVDNTQRLLVGTNAAYTGYGNSAANRIQIAGNVYSNAAISAFVFGNTQYGGYLNLGLSRNTTIDSHTVVNNNDSTGAITFNGSDGSAFKAGASIEGYVDGTPGTNDMPGRLVFSTTADGASSPTTRMTIKNDGKVGIGTTAPSGKLDVETASDTYLNVSTTNNGSGAGISLIANNNNEFFGYANNLRFATVTGKNAAGFNERARLDSSGRLLIGTSSARTADGVTGALQIEGTSQNTSSIQLTCNSSASPGTASVLTFSRSRGSAVGDNNTIDNGDMFGGLIFTGADGTDIQSVAAAILAQADNNPSSNYVPGRLVFMTGNGTSAIEKMRLTREGALMAQAGGGQSYNTNDHHHWLVQAANNYVLQCYNNNASVTAELVRVSSTAVQSSGRSLMKLWSGNGGAPSDTEFHLRMDGNAYADGSWNGGGADYAEFFEWSDGNTSEEDRRGISVVLDGDKIREAVAGEEPIGVISANPSVVGDTAWNSWREKYLRDDYGTSLMEDYTAYEWTDENGTKHSYPTDNVPDELVVPDDATTTTIDEHGNTLQRRILNPDYDPDVEYRPREQRPEWDVVGLMGKLRIRKGQVTGVRWIKMRDISDSVEEWLVR